MNETETKNHLTLITTPARPARCTLHPAFEADYCPSCGTSQVIGR